MVVGTVGVGRHARTGERWTKAGRSAASRTEWIAGQESENMSLNRAMWASHSNPTNRGKPGQPGQGVRPTCPPRQDFQVQPCPGLSSVWEMPSA